MDLVEVLGKKNKKVPVLLTKSMKEAVEALINTRDDVDIPAGNPYFFARVCISQNWSEVFCVSVGICKILVYICITINFKFYHLIYSGFTIVWLLLW